VAVEVVAVAGEGEGEAFDRPNGETPLVGDASTPPLRNPSCSTPPQLPIHRRFFGYGPPPLLEWEAWKASLDLPEGSQRPPLIRMELWAAAAAGAAGALSKEGRGGDAASSGGPLAIADVRLPLGSSNDGAPRRVEAVMVGRRDFGLDVRLAFGATLVVDVVSQTETQTLPAQ
jgi:hypothetical protein